jgi:hypothetical protein
MLAGIADPESLERRAVANRRAQRVDLAAADLARETA